MKLLIDQNLSPKLVKQLNDLFPDSSHLINAGLDKSPLTLVCNEGALVFRLRRSLNGDYLD